ncbi:MAG: 5-deoxy-glucuronate isomerase, partial [Tabrizicola sp.]|nr:5-deoxy-glucuronate isomerase [Tabrizicola sp.]
MPDLLRKPLGTHGLVHDITPENAGWSYVGFRLYRLQAGEVATGNLGTQEAIVVYVEGKAHLTGA